MRKYAALAIAAILTGLLIGVVIASSGGDDNGTTTQALPELKPPGGSIGGDTKTDTRQTDTTEQTQTETQTEPTQTQAPSGGTPAPPADTERNDTPPPSGSPAQKFEDFCAQNPGAC